MSGRKSLYELYCVAHSSTEIVCNAVGIGKQSLQTWMNTSMIARPILHQYQWFYDPKWEEARKLSQDIRANGIPNHKRHYKKKSTTSSVKKDDAPSGKRHFSTISKINNRLDGKKYNENDDSNDSDSMKKKEKKKKKKEEEKKMLESSNIPTSRLSRLYHYSSLAADIGFSAAKQSIMNRISNKDASNKPKKTNMKSLLLSNENIEKIVKKFSKMRGAALKIGQMLSFQDEKVLPQELYEILSRVQNNANYMPLRQLDKMMQREFNLQDWDTTFFKKFDKIPIAAASIGQVHEAVLNDGTEVVVKIQYPGVRDSIDSDLNNLLMLLTASSLLPKGLFLDKTIANARKELKWECDYLREGECLSTFEKILAKDPIFTVPHVYNEYTTANVLTMTRMKGKEIMKLEQASQELRDKICTNIMRLCLQEIAEYKYMQTDPNWANFLYNEQTEKIELIDFGATRPFPEPFISNYRKLLTSAMKRDRKTCEVVSKDLGYLTGLESSKMVEAHVDSVLVLGEPFAQPGLFDFGNQTVTDRIRGNISVMLNERLVPPPEETYSLHRKFSGVFLLCARMQARVPCHDLFMEHFAKD